MVYRRFKFYRKERVLKEKRFKEEITDLAKSIDIESQEVVRIATSVAEACTDRIMKQVRLLMYNFIVHHSVLCVNISYMTYTLILLLTGCVWRCGRNNDDFSPVETPYKTRSYHAERYHIIMTCHDMSHDVTHV